MGPRPSSQALIHRSSVVPMGSRIAGRDGDATRFAPSRSSPRGWAMIVSLVWLVAGCAHGPASLPGDSWAQDEEAGQIAFDAGRYREAERFWRSGLDLARGEAGPETRLLVKLARVDEGMGRYGEARRHAAKALEQARVIEDPVLEAAALRVLGLVARRLGEPSVALDYLRRSRQLAQRLGRLDEEGETVRYLALVHQDLGEDAEAERLYIEALALSREAGDRWGEARALNALGGLHRLRAEYADALTRYRESLARREDLGDRAGQALVHGNLCLLYQNLQDRTTAIGHCERSLALARAAGSRSVEANAHNNLGIIYQARGEYRRALAAYRRSLRIKEGLPDPAGAARTLNNIGDLERRLGRTERALAAHERALLIREEIADRPGQITSHQNLGVLSLQLAHYDEARDHFLRVLTLAGSDGRAEAVWRAFDGLAQVHAATGAVPTAVFFGKLAVNRLQGIRRDLRALDPSLQGGFLSDKEGVYRRLAGLLIDEGRFAEAQQVLAMLKEDEYFEFLRGVPDADPRSTRASLTRVEAPWWERYQEIQAQAVAIGAQYSELVRKEPLTPAEEVRLEGLERDLDLVEQGYRALVEDLRATLAAEGRGEFGDAEWRALPGFSGTLAQLGHGAVLLHYFVTDDRLRLLLTGPDPNTPVLHRESPVARAELNQLIWSYRAKLVDPCQDPAPEARALHRHLIEPVAEDLHAYGAKTLMVYLDQSLRYLPLAALQDGDGFLVDDYAVVIYTAAGKVNLLAPPVPDWRVAGLGTSAAVGGFSPLPAVRDELDAIVKLDPADLRGVWPGVVFVDQAFTAQRLQRVLNGDYQVVHLASHFHFAPGTAAESYLLTGDGERLDLQRMKLGRYPFTGLELLALSACETGLGAAAGDGREIESFGAIAQDKGAKAVIATLWKVPDRSTATFMERFHLNRRAGLTKAEALRRTQLAFIRPDEHGALSSAARGVAHVQDERCPSTTSGYAHPYYWAPFLLMGNWL
ncbi:hypothetical protein CKO41_03485 [Thiococcus pfennigii]|nr:hypothetical protein [Thiococcus pfennigii]